jgi:TPR repeat protein
LLVTVLVVSQLVAQSESSKLTLDELKTKAEAGDAAAECELGTRYMRADGVSKDYTEALKWVRKSAEQNYVQGQWLLANAYFHGAGIDRDYNQAFQWYEKAAKQGNVAAEAALGICYEFGRGVEENLGQANDWYRKAAALNNALAQNNLGNNLIRGRGIGRDVVQGYKWILLSAAQGNTYAVKSVTGFARSMSPSEISQARALAEAFRAADMSGSPAHLPPLPTPAQERSVAANATPTPSRNFSPGNVLGLEPLPTLPPMPVARSTPASLRERAEAGDAQAQCDIGFAYEEGNGVPKNYSEANKWLRKAAEQNVASAESALGFNYLSGLGVKKNAVEACKWLLKAAQQNNIFAQENLGYCYMNGFGVPRDDVQAYAWEALAAARGQEEARKNLAILNQRMSRTAIARAQQLVQGFRPNERGGAQEVPSQEGPPSQNGPLQAHNTGTGFFITDDGYLITNYHVVKDGAAVRLMTRHVKVPATVVEVDATNDLALLKTEGTYKALPVASGFDVKLGDSVSTIGFPLIDLQGISPKFTRGEISSLAGMKDDVRFFQISTPIQPGNSGGALVDEHGNVVGVTSATLTAAPLFKSRGVVPENVNYAIKSFVVRDFLKWALRSSDKLKSENTGQDKPADLIDRMQDAAVLVVVYWHGSQ